LDGDLKTDTTREILTAQGKTLHTKYRAKKNLKTETDNKYRL